VHITVEGNRILHVPVGQPVTVLPNNTITSSSFQPPEAFPPSHRDKRRRLEPSEEKNGKDKDFNGGNGENRLDDFDGGSNLTGSGGGNSLSSVNNSSGEHIISSIKDEALSNISNVHNINPAKNFVTNELHNINIAENLLPADIQNIEPTVTIFSNAVNILPDNIEPIFNIVNEVMKLI
jgi:hypothetical protein